MDLPIAVLLTAALGCFIIAMQHPLKEKKAKILLLSAYFCVALAIFTKGLIGIVLPLLTIGTWIICCKQWKVIPKMRLGAGLLLVAVFTGTWIAIMQHKNPEFIHYFFYIQQYSRYISHHFNNKNFILFLLGYHRIRPITLEYFFYRKHSFINSKK